MKFFTSDGGLDKADITSICEGAAAMCAEGVHDIPEDNGAAVVEQPFIPTYAGQLRELIKKGVDHPDKYDMPLEGFKVRRCRLISVLTLG